MKYVLTLLLALAVVLGVIAPSVGMARRGPEQPTQAKHPVPQKQTTAADEVKVLRQKAAQGNAKAQNDLGTKYAVGLGVPQDDAQAVVWYRKAAEQGDARAQDS